mmetsp:Transcript_6392/g.15448  ORF Transcript_6392/g.15448 Transcript_6392/m.15448 type:complete len:226 (+) Transcript_6392:911-1588(+)
MALLRLPLLSDVCTCSRRCGDVVSPRARSTGDICSVRTLSTRVRPLPCVCPPGLLCTRWQAGPTQSSVSLPHVVAATTSSPLNVWHAPFCPWNQTLSQYWSRLQSSSLLGPDAIPSASHPSTSSLRSQYPAYSKRSCLVASGASYANLAFLVALPFSHAIVSEKPCAALREPATSRCLKPPKVQSWQVLTWMVQRCGSMSLRNRLHPSSLSASSGVWQGAEDPLP